MFKRKQNKAGMKTDDATAFKTHIDLANSERTAIWARNSAMIVTNALLINATGDSPSVLKSIGCGTVGIITCWLWFCMTKAGWDIIHRHNRKAKGLWSDSNNNPLELRNTGESRDIILASTKQLIALFAVLHLFFMLAPVMPDLRGAFEQAYVNLIRSHMKR